MLKQPKTDTHIRKFFDGKVPRGLLAELKNDGLIIEDVILRGGAARRTEKFYRVAVGLALQETRESLKRAPSQAALFNYLRSRPMSLPH